MGYRLFIALFITIFFGCSTAVAKGTSKDGSSVKNAVVISAPNEASGIRAENEWIAENHPDWKKSRQSVVSSGDLILDKIDYVTKEGEQRTIYYDITSFFGKF